MTSEMVTKAIEVSKDLTVEITTKSDTAEIIGENFSKIFAAVYKALLERQAQ